MYLTNVIIHNHCSLELKTICDNIYWGNVIKNKVIKDSLFYRIYVKNALCTMNGMYIVLKLDNLKWTNHHMQYNIISNLHLINCIVQIEQSILNNHNIGKDSKKNTLLICDDIVNNRIKIANAVTSFTSHSTIMLKISGLWETATHRGLVYKFLIVNDITNSSNGEQNKII